LSVALQGKNGIGFVRFIRRSALCDAECGDSGEALPRYEIAGRRAARAFSRRDLLARCIFDGYPAYWF
jgi:hypothetical protein